MSWPWFLGILAGVIGADLYSQRIKKKAKEIKIEKPLFDLEVKKEYSLPEHKVEVQKNKE